jgi:hypothetical protein
MNMKTTLARINAIENRLPFDPAHWLRTNNVLYAFNLKNMQ